jgi:hypothetical protein
MSEMGKRGREIVIPKSRYKQPPMKIVLPGEKGGSESVEDMRSPAYKSSLRERLARDLASFESRGGQITILPEPGDGAGMSSVGWGSDRS